MTDARNFLLNTDYPLDKVVYMTSGSFIVAGSSATTQFNHNLSFRPLIIGTWSLNSDFSTSKEGGLFAFDGTDPTANYNIFAANDTQITISTTNQSGGSITVYYRIYGFMPTDANVDADFTSIQADNFQLNTDFNYTKLFMSGIATAAATTTITHSLGYRPQVITWRKDASIYGTEAVVDMGYVKATTTTVVITSPTKDVHYRIYADGQL